MTNEPPDPVSKRLRITLTVLLVLLVVVGGAIALLSEG
jgi:hypothetical protein